LPSFEIRWQGRPLGRASLAIPGLHNVYNALVACALNHRLGADPEAIVEALGEFTGALRRLTFRGRFQGIDVLDDYAHHPTEIRATLQAVRQRYRPRRLRVVFQPHQVSRTRFFLDDFASSLSLADEVLVPDIYFVRDSQSDRHLVSGLDLAERIARRGGRARYIPSLAAIAEYLAGEAQPFDLLLTMGAGDVWKVADEMVSRLRTNL
jgi:UDP-N-acetylmuramate--alanine ligase